MGKGIARREVGRLASCWVERVNGRVVSGWCRARAKLSSERGQGTTEYAILVGVQMNG